MWIGFWAGPRGEPTHERLPAHTGVTIAAASGYSRNYREGKLPMT